MANKFNIAKNYVAHGIGLGGALIRNDLDCLCNVHR